MAKHKLQTVAPIETKFVLPRGAQVVGYLNNNFEKPIVREKKRVAVRVPVLDADGKEAWKRNGTGTPIVQRFRNEWQEQDVEWVPHYDGRGQIRRNYDFRVDPAEEARLKRVAEVKRTQADLAEALVESGVSVADLVATIKDLQGGSKDET